MFINETAAVTVPDSRRIYLYGLFEERPEESCSDPSTSCKVFTVSNGEFRAVVRHVDDDMEALVRNPESLKVLLRDHEEVLESVGEKYGTVLPVAFGMVLKEESKLLEWMHQHGNELRRKIMHVAHKNEYHVTITCDIDIIGKTILRDDGELHHMEEEMNTLSPGRAYLHRQKIARLLKEKITRHGADMAEDSRKALSEAVSVVQCRKAPASKKGISVLLSLSLLADAEEVKRLGTTLDNIAAKEGLTVEFTGPWLPYSFV